MANLWMSIAIAMVDQLHWNDFGGCSRCFPWRDDDGNPVALAWLHWRDTSFCNTTLATFLLLKTLLKSHETVSEFLNLISAVTD
uniref:Uncharacterized protein n=1 Tax=Leersia perrieri TaxID=77586 RepID=A0A0D9X4G3_9ORYZ